MVGLLIYLVMHLKIRVAIQVLDFQTNLEYSM